MYRTISFSISSSGVNSLLYSTRLVSDHKLVFVEFTNSLFIIHLINKIVYLFRILYQI